MKSELPFSRPAFLLHAEGLCVLLASCGGYHLFFPHHWVMFACLFLVPDLSLLMFVQGSGILAGIAYNVLHSYVLPALLGMLAVSFRSALLGQVSFIWIAHIGFDRALGYGLKYSTSFRFTHIQSAANPAIVPSVPSTQDN